MSILAEQRELCLKLIGNWYLEDNSQNIEFDLLEQMFQRSRLVIRNSGQSPIETKYGIGLFPSTNVSLENQFYIDILLNPQKKYLIKSISKDTLILQIHNYYVPTEMICKYVRKIDLQMTESILSELFSI